MAMKGLYSNKLLVLPASASVTRKADSAGQRADPSNTLSRQLWWNQAEIIGIVGPSAR
jgi:hypothetical protein